MNNMIDKKLIDLQFENKIYKSNGNEFQKMFSNIMKQKEPDFVRIKPDGKYGDGGNDGYIPTKGVYFQVYSPETPNSKSSEASKKLIEDFEKLLKSGWEIISNIKEYHFVYNDKYLGITERLEKAIKTLSIENPNIKFSIIRVEDIQKIVQSFNHDQLALLDFDIDQTNTLKILNQQLIEINNELDKGHADFAIKLLNNIRSIVSTQENEPLILEFEIIEAKALQRQDKVSEAKEKFLDIYQRNPLDVRAPLYLAEIHLLFGEIKENEELLQEVKTIDESHWLYKLELLVRKSFLNETISYSEINTKHFPKDFKIKSDFYRLYGNLLRISNDKLNARSYINKAIHLYPDKFLNHYTKIAMDVNDFTLEKNIAKRIKFGNKILDEINLIKEKFGASAEINNRNKVLLNYKQAVIFAYLDRFNDFNEIFKETLTLIFTCSFDITIDNILTDLLLHASIHKDNFTKLINYIESSKFQPSTNLGKRMFILFLMHENINTKGKEFFIAKNLNDFLELINDLDAKCYNNFIYKFKNDYGFMIMVFNLIKDNELRKSIFNELPNNEFINKDKLNLLIEFDNGNFEKSFKLLKKIDLNNINYTEGNIFIDVAMKMQAWDYVILIGKRIFEYEKTPEELLKLKLTLFIANLNLERLKETVILGEEILNNSEHLKLLSYINKNFVLQNTLISLLKRNSHEDNLKAEHILEFHKNILQCFNSNSKIASEIYIRNNKPQKALESIIFGLSCLNTPSCEDYASLYININILLNVLKIELINDNIINDDQFIKFKGEDQWHYIGNKKPLDAQSVKNSKLKYFIGKKTSDVIDLSNDFSSQKIEKEIEYIYSIDKYIIWKICYHFYDLSNKGISDNSISIELPEREDGKIDYKYLKAFMKLNHDKGLKFFELYCNQTLPFGSLVLNEGDIPNAIGRIISQKRGYINMSDGTQLEFQSQKDTALDILTNKAMFYLDGTSAWLLAETGILNKIVSYIPNMKVPQSVVNMLFNLRERVSNSPKESGKIIYFEGNIGYLDNNQEYLIIAQDRISQLITTIESNCENISFISTASKDTVFSENKFPGYLADATILAQKENIPVLTEDFRYLQLNELETKKKRPQYFSLFALMRVLLEKNQISLPEYLDFFSLLAQYRFKFLHLFFDDLEKAILLDCANNNPNIDNFKKLHLNLTLSKDFGVDQNNSFRLICHFMFNIIYNDLISTDICKNAFIEITSHYKDEIERIKIQKTILDVLQKFLILNPYKSRSNESISKLNVLYTSFG